MSGRGLAVLLGVLAALVGVAFWITREPPEDEAPAATLLAPEIRPEIVAVTLRGSSGTCHLARQGGGWRITSPLAFEADPREVGSLLNRLTRLELSEPAAPEGADGGPFGFGGESPGLELVLDDGAVVRIAMGDVSPVGPERYVRTGEGPVRLAPAELASLVERDCITYAETRFLPVEAQRILRVDVNKAQGATTIVRKGESWEVFDLTDRFPANPSRTERWLRDLVSWSGNPPGDQAGATLDVAALLSIEVTLDDGTLFQLIGSPSGDGLRLQRGSLLGTVDPFASRILDDPIREVCERRLAFFSRDDAAEIVLAGPDGTTVLTRDGSRWSSAAGEADGGRVTELLDRLGRLSGLECLASSIIEDTEAVWLVELKDADGEPLGRFHFDGAGGAGTSWRGGGHPIEIETQDAILNGTRELLETSP